MNIMHRSLPFAKLAITLACLGHLAALQAQPTGQWDFNSGDLSATVGQPLQYGISTQAGTTFGTTTQLGLPDIDGTPAHVMGFAAFELGSGYKMPTPAAANGGGSLVNNWTLILDLLYPASSDGTWRAIIDVDESYIEPDAEFFINPSNGIGISGNYSGQILPDTWYRIAIVMESTTGMLHKYINGLEVGSQNLGDVFEGRWTMSPGYFAELFADNDGDVAPGYVNSIQVRDQVLSAGQIAALGSASASGIPQTIPSVASFLESRAPGADAVNVSPSPQIQVVLNQGDSTVTQSSVQLLLDDTQVTATVTPAGAQLTVTYALPTVLAALSEHTLQLNWTDSIEGSRTETWTFTVADYAVINLPDPVHLETFDSVAEGALPAGWVVTNRTDQAAAGLDLANAHSDSYKDFVVISTETLAALNVNSGLRLAMNPIVVNGQSLSSLVSGSLAYAESDVRSGNQVQVLFSPDFDLSGQDSVYLSYHSMYEQNQDSIGAVEYSIDGGATWLPVVYMVAEGDVILNGAEVDAVATLTTPRTDQAHGEAYGTWIGAEVTQALAPFISGRVDDDELESKRVELFRLPNADRQSRVRLRFMQAGTASWYFGIDDVGLYSITAPIPPTVSEQPISQWVHSGGSFTLTVAATGTEPFTYQWRLNGKDIPGATDATYTVDTAQTSQSGNYEVIVSNGGGSATSARVSVNVFAGPISQDLVVHLMFDNNLTDASGRNHNAQAVGSPTFVPGLIGTHAVHVPSGQDYVSLGAPADLDFSTDTDFSVSFWALLPAGGWNNDPSFVGNKNWDNGNNQGYVLATDDDGRLQWNVAGPPGGRKDYDSLGGFFGNDQWHHVVVTFDRSETASTYIDAVLINRKSVSENANDLSTPSGNATNIGQDGTGTYGPSFSNLSVDDLGIWRRVLTPEEVSAVRDAGLQGQDLSTVIVPGGTVEPEIATIQADQGTLTLTWPTAADTRLQKASDLDGSTWVDVAGTLGQGTHSETIGAGPAFYRLQKGGQ